MLLFLTSRAPGSPAHPTEPTPYGDAGWLRQDHDSSWLHRAPGADPRAVIYAARALEASHLVSVEEGLGINRLLRPGDWLVPDDYIEQTKGQPTTFFESRGMGYLQQSPAFPPALRERLVGALARVGLAGRQFDRGSYLAVNSLRRLTPAEARAARIWGADVAGGVALPEGTLAKELEMGYAILLHVAACVPESPEAGALAWQSVAPEEIAAVAAAVEAEGLPSLHGTNTMARSLVGDDWQEWVG